jgi:two-component system phosphate regulon sensor histidine kinase PhoR
MAVIVLFIGTAIGFFIRSGLGGRDAPAPVHEEPHEDQAADGAFDRLVRALPLGILMVDRSARVTVANRAAGLIFGFDARRATGLHVIEAVASVELERRVDEALEGEASLGPLIVPGKAGSRTYSVSAYPVTTRNEVVIGALVLAEDQTELIALERARQDFMSNVSHELRTPLSSIKLMLETVMASPDQEAADLFLPQVQAEVDRLTTLVGQLLDQARAQAGQLLLNLREVDLEEIAAPIVASFTPTASAKGVALDLRALRPVTLEADADRLSQVFVNLIDNALRHTPEGGAVGVELDAEGGSAIVRVRDTGEGIPYKDLPHVFERFYVVDRSRARETSGAGLGLSIVKQIVDAHGGKILAESMLGSGATLTVRVPILHVKTRDLMA